MSVINNALRDLQQQRPLLRAVDPEELRARPPRPPRRRQRTIAFALAGLLLALLAGYGLSRPGSPPIATPVQRPPAIAPEPSPISAPEPVTVAELDGVQLREQAERLSLEFHFSRPAGIALEHQQGRRYRFRVSGARSAIAAPVLEDNPWLAALTLRPSGDGLLIELETREGVRVLTEVRHPGDGSQQWVLNLEHRTITPVEKADSGPQAVTDPVAARTETRPALDAVTTGKSRPSPPADAVDDPVPKTGKAAPPPRVEIRARPAPRPPAEQRRREAHALFRAGEYAALIRRFDGDSGQDDLRALAYQRLGQHEQALSLYRSLLQRDTANARYWLGLGLSLEQMDQPQAAASAYRRARELGGLSARLQAFVRQRLRQPGQQSGAGGHGEGK